MFELEILLKDIEFEHISRCKNCSKIYPTKSSYCSSKCKRDYFKKNNQDKLYFVKVEELTEEQKQKKREYAREYQKKYVAKEDARKKRLEFDRKRNKERREARIKENNEKKKRIEEEKRQKEYQENLLKEFGDIE